MVQHFEETYEVRQVDHEDDPALHVDHFASFDALREETPGFFNDIGEGYWFLTRGEDIRGALQNYGTFSNERVFIKKQQVRGGMKYIPQQLDPPEHTPYRQLLIPLFSPGMVDRWDGFIRSRCEELVHDLAQRSEIDFMEDFARQYPTGIFCEIAGFPQDRRDQLVEWATTLVHLPAAEDPDGARKAEAFRSINEFLISMIEEKRRNPADDMFSRMVQFELDGKPLTDDVLLNMSLLLFNAGLDTVAGALGYFFAYLARNPEQRHRLIAEPQMIPHAVEELLRVFSTVAPGRLVTSDIEVAGCPMRKGDMVYMPLSCANRDPREFDSAAEVDFDRSPNRHIAFGAGPHRCLGSHLARRELQVVLEVWHREIPDYRILDESALIESVTGLSALHSLPLMLGASA